MRNLGRNISNPCLRVSERQCLCVAHFPPGSVTDEYELGEKLGEGHFGSTFACTHRSSGKRYAVKKISKTRLLMLGTPLEEVKREVGLARAEQGVWE